MKKIVRKIITFYCVVGLIINLSNVAYINATTEGKQNEARCDEVLQSLGTPESVLDDLDENFKQYICANLEKGEKFDSYTNQDLREENLIETKKVATYISTIPSSDIKVSLYATGIVKNGKKYVKIYPSYIWKKSCDIGNDTFAVSLYSGWECVGNDKPELTVSAINWIGNIAQTYSFSSTDASETGYSFKIPTGYGGILPRNGRYEGYGHFLVRRKISNATKTATVKYIHDNSPNYSLSYGISIGPASISISGNTDDLQVYAANMNFSYNYSTK